METGFVDLGYLIVQNLNIRSSRVPLWPGETLYDALLLGDINLEGVGLLALLRTDSVEGLLL